MIDREAPPSSKGKALNIEWVSPWIVLDHDKHIPLKGMWRCQGQPECELGDVEMSRLTKMQSKVGRITPIVASPTFEKWPIELLMASMQEFSQKWTRRSRRTHIRCTINESIKGLNETIEGLANMG